MDKKTVCDLSNILITNKKITVTKFIHYLPISRIANFALLSKTSNKMIDTNTYPNQDNSNNLEILIAHHVKLSAACNKGKMKGKSLDELVLLFQEANKNMPLLHCTYLKGLKKSRDCYKK